LRDFPVELGQEYGADGGHGECAEAAAAHDNSCGHALEAIEILAHND